MRWSRLGPRREVLILLPAAILLLALVSTFTLLSYRASIQDGIEERRIETARLASALAQLAGRRRTATSLELLAMAPQARGLALLDGQGNALMSSGELSPGEFLPEEFREPGGVPASFGPGRETGNAVVAIVPVEGAEAHYLRLELPASSLGAHQGSLRLLAILVVGANSGVLLLVMFFLRHLLAPWEILLEKARLARGEEGVPLDLGDQDEVALLLSTFERGLSAEARAAAGNTEDDIEALQRTLTQSFESGLLLLDREGSVVTLNEVGQELLGLERSPEPGMTVEEALEPHRALARLLQGALDSGQGFKRREASLRVAEKRLTLGLSLHPLRRDDRQVRGYLVLFADLTEAQRRAEEVRLEESLALLGEMAAGVAHELRNSLATLRGYLTLIERRPSEEAITDYLGEIRHEANQLQRVLEDFLLFTRPGSARPESVALGSLVRRAAADPALEGAEVDLRLADELPQIFGDEQLLERAIRNLLGNAAQAQREAEVQQPIEVSLRSQGDKLLLTIEDHGIGLPDAVRERLFQPFASGFRGGVGLGLALTHRIVSMHGGGIRLEDATGGGVRAEVEFPIGGIATKGNDSEKRGISIVLPPDQR